MQCVRGVRGRRSGSEWDCGVRRESESGGVMSEWPVLIYFLVVLLLFFITADTVGTL